MPLDPAALYQSHGPMVLRRCRRLLRDDAKALDAMHDVFIEILRRREALDDRAPAGLLLKTATNVCLNKLRGERRHPEDREERLLFAIAASDADSPETQALSRRFLDRVFGRVSPSNRLLAVLYYVDQMTHEEVARELGLSVSASASASGRCNRNSWPLQNGGGAMAERPNQVPEWLVERLVAGDLDAATASAVRARLTDGGELGRVDDIAKSNRALLAQHPAAEAVAEIERRLAQLRMKEAATESALRRFWPGLAVAVPALAVALILVFAPRGEQEHVSSVPVVERETVTSKGLSPTLVLYKQVGNGAELLGTSDRVGAGDVLQVAYVSAGRPYGVIASIDALGVVTLHLPEAPGHAAPLQRERATPLPHAFELDDSPGFERFVFATSTRPFATNELVDALAAGRLEQLPADLEVSVRTVEKGAAP